MARGEQEEPGKLKSALADAGRIIIVCGAIAAGLGVTFVALLALALTLSSDTRIAAHLKEAFDRGVLTRQSYPASPYGHLGHAYDMYSDCVALSTNLSNAEDGLLRRIAASPMFESADGRARKIGSCEMLAGALEAGSAKADVTYLRFWHGYQAYTRPMLSAMSLANVRRLTAALFYGVLIFFAHRLALWFGPWAWPVALLPFFLVGDFLTVPVVLSHTLSLTWIFLSVALVTVILDRVKSARTLILPAYVFAAGATTNFLSFLFNPPLAPALIAFLVIAHDIRHRTYRTPQSLLYAGGLAALWFAGYFAIWIEKWAFAALVLGPDAVAGELMANVGKYEGISRAEGLGLLGATWDNLAPNGLFLGYIVCSIAVAVTLIAWLMKTRRCTAEHFVEFLAMLTPLLVIVVWVELNPGHSAWHTGFVSRSFLLFSVIPLLAALLIWRRTSPLPALGRASAEPAPG